MHTIFATNVNDALPQGLAHLRKDGVKRDSRNGPVLVAPEPVTTIYSRPWQRVLFSPERDANPFFHLVESVWMLAGRDTVINDLVPYVKRMRDFSDDDCHQWGAYGKRWRSWFGSNSEDQLLWAIKRLKENPDDRRVVISMWDGDLDPYKVNANGKDVPCNTHIYAWIDPAGALSLTVCCRSNDIIWGAYGANAVHFSVLQEFLASAIGVPMGRLYQVSNNFHAYVEVMEKYGKCEALESGYPLHQPIVLGGQSPEDFLEECELIFSSSVDLLNWEPLNDWLRLTVKPAIIAHRFYKLKQFEMARINAAKIKDPAWSEACHTWLSRRQAARKRAEDDGVSYDS